MVAMEATPQAELRARRSPSRSEGQGRAAATRARIVASAGRCFARFGLARTRMDDVAAGAGVSRALVYEYFASKRKLLAVVQREALADWFAAYEAAVADTPSVRAALTAWLGFCLTDSDRHALARAVFVGQEGEGAGAWSEWRIQLRDEWLARLTALLERGIARGELRAGLDAEATALALRGLQVGVTQQVLGDPETGVARERQIAAAIDLMLAGLLPPART